MPPDNGLEIDVAVEADGWVAIDGPAMFAENAARAALEALAMSHLEAELSILLTDDRRIAELNDAFRGRKSATNVLSWPSVEWGGRPASPSDVAKLAAEDGPSFSLGDVALAIETLQREAESFGRTLEHHAAHLIVHGVLHLVGYDHTDEDTAAVMEAVETSALERLGFPGRDA